jgi:hypothetical protein
MTVRVIVSERAHINQHVSLCYRSIAARSVNVNQHSHHWTDHLHRSNINRYSKAAKQHQK